MSGPPHDWRDRVFEECLIAVESGDFAPLERACEAHPEMASELRKAAAVVVNIRGLADARPRPALDGLTPGVRVGRYVVKKELGSGGMGAVYLALDERLGREVALKRMAPHVFASREGLARFQREARALAQLRHPNIVTILDVVETRDGAPCLVLELVKGYGLDVILDRRRGKADGVKGSDAFVPPAGPLEYARWVAGFTASLANALAHAHALGFVHRDVKPSNVLVDPAGNPHLVDFGVALDARDSQLTRTGGVVGTPAYMAPEQIDPRIGSLGPVTDVYSTGVVLYELLTLKRAFTGSISEVHAAVLDSNPVRPRRLAAATPKDLETICLKAFARDPERRYASAAALLDDLHRFLSGQPIRAQRATWGQRAAKWAARNRTTAVAYGASALTLISVAGLAGWKSWNSARDASSYARGLTADLGNFESAVKSLDEIDLEIVALELDCDRNDWTGTASSRHVGLLGEEKRRAARVAEAQTVLENTLHAEPPRSAQTPAIALAITRARCELWRRAVKRGSLEGFERKDPPEDSLRSKAQQDVSNLELLTSGDESSEGVARQEAARLRRALDAESEISFSGLLEGVDVHLFRFVKPTDTPQDWQWNRPYAVPHGKGTNSSLDDASMAASRWLNFDGRPPSVWRDSDEKPGSGDQYLLVDHVKAGSLAERMGVRVGDLVGKWTTRGNAIRTGPSRLYVRDVDPKGPAFAAGVRRWHRATFLDKAFLGGGIDRLEVDLFPVTRERDHVLVFNGLDERETRVAFTWNPKELVSGICQLEANLKLRFGDIGDLLEGAAPDDAHDLELVILTERSEVLHVKCPAGAPIGISAHWIAQARWCTGERSRVGTSPLEGLRLKPGSYFFVLRRQGWPDVLVPVFVNGIDTVVKLDGAYPASKAPPGFVYVAGGPFVSGEREPTDPSLTLRSRTLPGYWIARHELSTADYLEFLNDPAILGKTLERNRRNVSQVYWEAARVPRARTTDPAFKFLWELPSTPTRPFVSTWDERIPVHGVSWQDGVDYCEWLTAKCQVDPAGAAWKGWRFRLPTVYELEKASRGVDGRTYPWGRDFDNAYVLTSSFFGTALPPENEFRFPRSMRASIDESPYGAFDLSGSLLEYGLTRRWAGEKGSGEPRSAWKGGSVNESRAHAFKATAFGFGGLNRTASHDGFRIVAERIEASK